MAKPPRRSLTTTQRQQIVELYRAGKTFAEIAGEQQIARSTAMRIVHAAKDVEVRAHWKVTDEQIDQAVELYTSGSYLREIGERFGVSTECVRQSLLKRGVEMREGRGGRQGAS